MGVGHALLELAAVLGSHGVTEKVIIHSEKTFWCLQREYAATIKDYNAMPLNKDIVRLQSAGPDIEVHRT